MLRAQTVIVLSTLCVSVSVILLVEVSTIAKLELAPLSGANGPRDQEALMLRKSIFQVTNATLVEFNKKLDDIQSETYRKIADLDQKMEDLRTIVRGQDINTRSKVKGKALVTNATLAATLSKLFGPNVYPRAKYSLKGIDKIYVTHWSGLPSRLTEMKKRLTRILPPDWKESNLVSFIKVFDKADITPKQVNELAISPKGGVPMRAEERRGTLSIAAKHHMAYYDQLYFGYNSVLIIEDDVDFVPNFMDEINQILHALPKGWSNCFLADPHPRIKCTAVNDKVCRQPRGSASQGCVAYLMSYNASRLMLNSMPIRTAPDFQMNWVSKNNGEFLAYRTTPYLAFENSTSSLSWKGG